MITTKQKVVICSSCNVPTVKFYVVGWNGKKYVKVCPPCHELWKYE